MKAKSNPQASSVNRLTLEQRTMMYWQVSMSYNHPYAKPMSCEQAIKQLSDAAATPFTLKLRKKAEGLLDDVIGIPKAGASQYHAGDWEPPSAA